ncbi:MAG: ABC1 kinase family protein [Bacteriovoracia bacterium]
MDLIKTGIGLTKTIKNVARLREILTVFSRNGFRSYIVKSGLGEEVEGIPSENSGDEIPSDAATRGDEGWALIGIRLRKSFEELGPSFVKMGQLLATREDLFDPALIRELKKLQNEVKPISFEDAKTVIQESLGQTLSAVFRVIEEKPIGTASIGVVYRGELLSGEKVVIKVRRPGIEKTLRTDFEIVRFMATQAERISSDAKAVGLVRVIDDFFRATMSELNFMTEAQNCERLKANLVKIDLQQDFVIPKIFREFSSSQVLVMEFLDGKPFNQFRSLSELGPSTVERLERSVELFAHTLLADGFFHADLHGGNFFILKEQKIGLIDFGLMGTLSKKNRANLIAVLYALITHNYDNLVYEFLEVAEYDAIPDHEELIRDIKDNLSPFIGLSVKETNVTELVRAIIRTLSKHRLYLPREWFIIFRALMTLDGVGKSVGLDLNIFKILEKDIPKLLGEVLTKENAQEEAMWIGKDLLTSLRIVPKHLKWFLREQAKRGYAFELKVQGADGYVRSISRSLYFLGLSVLAGIFILVGALPLIGKAPESFTQVPTVSWIFWSLGALILIRSLVLKKY